MHIYIFPRLTGNRFPGFLHPGYTCILYTIKTPLVHRRVGTRSREVGRLVFELLILEQHLTATKSRWITFALLVQIYETSRVVQSWDLKKVS